MAYEHNTISWESHTLTTSDGVDYNIVAGTTTDDITGRLAFDGTTPLLYYIYWYENEPTEYSTILASAWGDIPRLGYHIISEVMPQVSTLSGPDGDPQANITHTVSTPMLSQVNISQVGVQDSITGGTISNIGTTATTGKRLKFNTPGADATGAGVSADASRHWIRGYSANSVADTGGRWLDIDGFGEAITIRDGLATDRLLGKFDYSGVTFYDGSSDSYILSGFNEDGMKFYNGTSIFKTDATTVSHYGDRRIKYYNTSGLGDTHLRMMIDSNDTTGLDGSLGEGVTFYNDSGYIMLAIDANGVTFFNGTITGTQSDDIISKWTNTELMFYTAGGSDTEDRKVRIGIGATAGMTLFGVITSGLTGASTIQWQSAPAGSENTLGLWTEKAYLGLWRHDTVVDDLLMYVPTSDIYLKSGRLDGSLGGSRIRLEASAGLVNSANGWAVHSSSASNGYHYNLFYPYNTAGDLYPDGTATEPFNYIGYYKADLSMASGAIALAASMTAVASYYFNGGYGSGAYPSHTFTYDNNTGMYRVSEDVIGFSAGGTGRFAMSATALYPIADEAYDLGTTSLQFNDAYVKCTSSSSGTNLVVTVGGKIVKETSSIRYKDNVKTLDFDSSQLDKLRPVSFNYKFDNASGIGLIAEEVNEIYPELIQYNEDGDPEAVKYNSLSVILLDEVKKLRKEVRDLKEKH
jgi:hypothetical protein